jgi:hypothetical protein
MMKLFILFFLFALSAKIALAKQVNLEWDKVDGAVRYELLIEKDGKPAVQTFTPKAEWNGDLGFGVYVYQIRGADKSGRSGEWSQMNPLVVMSDAPKKLAPISKQKLKLMQNQALHLEWEPIEGVHEYYLEIFQAKKLVLGSTVDTNEFRTAQLPEGIYSWRVTGVLSAGKNYPALADKKWKTKPSPVTAFKLSYQFFEKPKIIFPIGDQWPTESGIMKFSWESVPSAEAYEIRVTKKFGASDSERKKDKILIAETTSINVNVGKEGAYSWSLRPLTDVQGNKENEFNAGQASFAEFRLLRDFLTEGNTWLVDASALYNRGKYKFSDRLSNLNGSLDSNSFTLRTRAEYWLRPNWAIGSGIEATFFNINSQANQRFSFELFAKRRIELGFGWYLGAALGAEFRQYPEISFVSLGNIGVNELGSYGPMAALDLSKQFTERWSMRLVTRYYLPLVFTDNIKNSGSDSKKNYSFGAQALYWASKRVGIAAGAFLESRSLGYTAAGNYKTIGQDGFYVFLSGLFRFE